MAIPGWALALGAAKIAPEMANDWMGLYKSIKENNTVDNNRQVLSDFALAQSAPEQQPQWDDTLSGGILSSSIPTQKDRFRQLKTKIGTGVYSPDFETGAKVIGAIDKQQEEGLQKKDLAGGYGKLISAFQKDPNTPLNQVAANMTPGELSAFMKEAGGKMDDWTKAGATQMETGRKAQLAIDTPKAYAELSDIETRPEGYKNLSELTGAYSRLAGKYPGVFGPEDIKRFTDMNRAYWEQKPMGEPAPYSIGVGRSQETGLLQNFALGAPKNIAQTTSVAPAPRITINNEQRRDFKDEMGLRKEFLALPEVKEYPTVEAQTQRAVKALSEQGKGSNVAVDQSIITIFNKMLDPASVVRESEYARTPQDLSVLSRIKGKWDKIQKGGAGLDATERAALQRMVNNFSEIASQQYNNRVGEYKGLARDYGYNAERVVPRKNALNAKQTPTPQQAAAELARRRAAGGK